MMSDADSKMKLYASPASSFARKVRVMLRAPQFFPQEKYPGLARLWKKMEARDSMKKTAPPAA